jgi:tetratricopeptide (TPR) repeat protein
MLYAHRRYDLAVKELREALLQNPFDATAHAHLALCLIVLNRDDEASKEARQAVHLAPEIAFSHYALAFVLENLGQLGAAKAAVQECTRIAPTNADYWARLANIELMRREWKLSLDAAVHGLECNPVHQACALSRALALVNLGHNEEAQAAIKEVLRRNPEHGETHLSMGWALLHAGSPQSAIEHFREALRINPRLWNARIGLVEALKARNYLYRGLLKCILWMFRRRSGNGAILFLVPFMVFAWLSMVAVEHPQDKAPVGLLVLSGGITLLLMLGQQIFNLLLRFDPLGRLALSPRELLATNYLAVCVGISSTSALFYECTAYFPALVLMFVSAVAIMPMCDTALQPPGPRRRWLVAYTVGIAVAGLTAVAAAHFWEGRLTPTSWPFPLAIVTFFLGIPLTLVSNFRVAYPNRVG